MRTFVLGRQGQWWSDFKPGTGSYRRFADEKVSDMGYLE